MRERGLACTKLYLQKKKKKNPEADNNSYKILISIYSVRGEC